MRELNADVCVIGAGIAGLTYAALAARQGQRVVVLEQHYIPGGCFSAFRTKGFVFNVALEWTTGWSPGMPQHRLLQRLGLDHAYGFEPIEVFKTVVSPELGAPLPLPAGRAALETSLAGTFPGEAAAIARFLDDATCITEGGEGARGLFLKCSVRDVPSLLDTYFQDRVLKHLLYSLVGCAARGVLLMYIVGALATGQLQRPSHHDHRRLPILLYRQIRASGGKVLLSTPARRVVTEHGRVLGVQADADIFVRASRVVATVDPHQLAHRLLADLPQCPGPLASELSHAPGASCLAVFLGLDAPPAALAVADGSFSVLAPTADWQRAPADCRFAPMRVELQSRVHQRLAPPSQATLCAWVSASIADFDHWGQGRECDIQDCDRASYLRAKQAAAGILVDRLAAVVPGLKAGLRVVEAATPFTFKRYTWSQGGSVCGIGLDNAAYLRRRSPFTGIEGLYHIGHWTTQSGINTGMLTAWDLFRTLEAPALASAGEKVA